MIVLNTIRNVFVFPNIEKCSENTKYKGTQWYTYVVHQPWTDSPGLEVSLWESVDVRQVNVRV